MGLDDRGGGEPVDGLFELETILNKLLADDQYRNEMGEAARKFVHEKAGAAQEIIGFIQENRLLTN